MYSDPPAWKQLLSPTLATHKRIPLITTIYSTSDEVEIARNLFGDDAQTFVDVIDEVSIHTFSPQQDESVCPLLTLLCPSVSHWTASRHGFIGGACILYTVSVAARPYFRDHWQFRFATARRRTHCVMVRLQTYGRADIEAGT